MKVTEMIAGRRRRGKFCGWSWYQGFQGDPQHASEWKRDGFQYSSCYGELVLSAQNQDRRQE